MPDDPARVPESRAVPKRRTRLSAVWLVPIVAAAAGAWVAVTRIMNEGPTITIVWQSAEGLEAGKTKIHYNGVDVGTITTIRLSDDHKHVITIAQMAPKTDDFLVDDTRFWVVRPRISGANVTGLGTLISGSYIGMEIGHSDEKKRAFVGLETPPVVTGDVQGRFFMLKTPDLGSLDSGTPLFFRRLQVGEVAAYQLDPDGKALSVKFFIRAPYDQYVTPNTRFWQASGIDLSLTASGLDVQTQSLLSILIGGIAFETPAQGPVLAEAEAGTIFTLFKDRAAAFQRPAEAPQTYALSFNQSVRGLAAGAPVEFRGIPVGQVVDVQAVIDAATFAFSITVTVEVDAERLGVEVRNLRPGADLAELRHQLIDSLVAHGVRAQLRSGSLLTGAQYVALDFFPDAAPVTVDWSHDPPLFPTIPGQLEAVEARVIQIIDKIDALPWKAIGDDLRSSLAELDRTLGSARTALDSGKLTLDHANALLEPGSALGTELSGTLDEVTRAARSMRVLADFLERHPEALIRGKRGGPQ
jgi:paraquat-inducible protein B